MDIKQSYAVILFEKNIITLWSAIWGEQYLWEHRLPAGTLLIQTNQ